MILLDTSFLFAIKAEKDKNYQRANEILDILIAQYNELKIIPYSVLNETITLAVARFNANKHYLKTYYDLFWGSERFFEIIGFEIKEYSKISQVLIKYCSGKKKLSFTDASLIYIYEKYDAKAIVSFDSHFDNILTRLF
ncbi:MAG: PIN domain protein (modular protein) [Promethearchaeota archaeon]|nr:MAG: PIN domain protein (modular protein) [Candidatus Lokiarchaeota archaeon]